ncbi:MAG: hypothetical protein HY938_02305 [Nitrosomonadales bacterium]|nr:hypothetical protein [Nitrosomonadales bacterium]
MLRKFTLSRRPWPLLLACSAFLLAVAALAPMASAATLSVSLVISDSSPPYRQFADSFSRHLAASQPEVSIVESQAISGTHADLIVAVGMKAAELAAAQNDTPVLAVMVPDAGYRALLAQMPPQKDKRDISAIFLNQPWNRRLDFLRAALPERRRIGLLYTPDTGIDIEGLRREIAKRGALLIAQPVRSQDRLFAVLESVLADSDILLAIPDGAIYSSSNIRNILLTSYRRNVPLVGVSAAYVNAGALCAIFSTPEQLAMQASATVISFARNRILPAAEYPDAFVIEVNQPVARSLGIVVPAQEAIRGQMDKNGDRDR